MGGKQPMRRKKTKAYDQGTYSKHGPEYQKPEKRWICPNDETENTGPYCIICGNPAPGSNKKTRNTIIAVCMVFCILAAWLVGLFMGLSRNGLVRFRDKTQEDNNTSQMVPPMEKQDFSAQKEIQETENSLFPTQAHQPTRNVMISTFDFLGVTEDYNTDRMHELEEAMSQMPFWGQSDVRRNEIKKIVFVNVLENKEENYWDISEAGDESVIAWVTDGVLYVAADGIITLNRSAVGMFSSFINVTAIEFNNNIDTSQVTDMQDMFLGCWSLRSVDLSCFNTSNVTFMSSMFGSTSLEQLDISMFDTANVTSLAGMFANCEDLQSLDVSNFNTAKVESMSSMFANCYALSDINLSGMNTENVTDMNGLFYRCHNLKELDISGFDTKKVKDMSWMFAACKMQQLDVSGFQDDGLENVVGMFHNSSIDVLKSNSNVIQGAYENR